MVAVGGVEDFPQRLPLIAVLLKYCGKVTASGTLVRKKVDRS